MDLIPNNYPGRFFLTDYFVLFCFHNELKTLRFHLFFKVFFLLINNITSSKTLLFDCVYTLVLKYHKKIHLLDKKHTSFIQTLFSLEKIIVFKIPLFFLGGG